MAKESNNVNATARQLGINESCIRKWKTQEDEIRKAKQGSRIVKARRLAKYPELEKKVCEFVDGKRKKGLPCSREDIRDHALRVKRELGIQDNFRASSGWCTRFMKRNLYSDRRPTKIAQKLPDHYVDKMFDFQRFIIRRRGEAQYLLQSIGNMDETPVCQDMLPRNTVDDTGKRSILIKSTGHEKSRYTVVLCAMADGTKLKPMIIFKRKTPPKWLNSKGQNGFPSGVVIHWNEKGWMDEAACLKWIKEVWGLRPGHLRNPKSLLVWDHFAAHLTDGVKQKVRQYNTNVAVIPGGLTGVLQPLDVSLNKPFKDGLRRRWKDWIGSGQQTFTKSNNMRAADLRLCATWVKESWDDIPKEMIIKSFKKCCISNAMDGTEDDMIWEDRVRPRGPENENPEVNNDENEEDSDDEEIDEDEVDLSDDDFDFQDHYEDAIE